MLLSIIIPVYRVEHTLRRCIDSVLAQDFTDWEMWLIDDGSPDGSPQICDEYAVADGRIRVVHQANAGLGAARNTGLKRATGEYVTFIDSDDYLAPDTYSQLMQTLAAHPEYDLLEYPFYKWYGAKEQQHLVSFEQREYPDKWDYWFGAEAYAHTYAWNKIYRRAVFDGIGFAEGKIFEDVYTLPLVLDRCRCVGTTDKGLYYYTYNAGGITFTADGLALRDLLHAHLPVVHRLAAMPQLPTTQERMAAYYAHVLNVQIDVAELTGEEPLLPVLPYRSTLKLKLLHLIGLKNLCRLFKLLHKFYRSSRW